MISVRKAAESDFPVLLEMTKLFHAAARFHEFAPWDGDKWEAWLHVCVVDDSAVCLVAVDDDTPIGFLTAMAVPAYWNTDVVICQETVLWCMPKARGKGAGTALIEALAKWGVECDCDVAVVCTQQHMEPRKTAGRYRTLGFELAEKAFTRRL